MNRWAVALILVPAALLVTAITIYWQTEAGQGAASASWMYAIVAATIFLILAMYASQMASRIGRAILVTIALVLDGLLGFLLWYLMTMTTLHEQVALG